MADHATGNTGVKGIPHGHGRDMTDSPAGRHDTDVRRRKGIWIASCSCGWTTEAMSAFTAWSSTRRHLTDTGALAIRRPVPKQPAVRLLDEPAPPAH